MKNICIGGAGLFLLFFPVTYAGLGAVGFDTGSIKCSEENKDKAVDATQVVESKCAERGVLLQGKCDGQDVPCLK